MTEPVTPPKPARELIRVSSDMPLMDTGRFEHYQRLAHALSNSTLLPDSIRGANPDQCFSNLLMVMDLAERWQVNAINLAQCISIIQGKMCIEGKLVAALIDKHLGVELDYEWVGSHKDGDKYGIIVTGTMPDTGKVKKIDGTVGDWKTFDKSGGVKKNWVGLAARNQLAYRGAREWCRLYEPALVLGVYSDDEMDERRERATPPAQPIVLNTGFATAQPEPAKEEPAPIDAEFTEKTAAGAPVDAQDGDGAKPATEAGPETEAPAGATEADPKDPSEEHAEAEAGEDAGAEGHAMADQALEDAARSQAMEDIAAELQELDKYPALLSYCGTLPSLKTWPNIKGAHTEAAKTEDWKRATEAPGQFAIKLVRRRTYERAMQLKKPPKVVEDITLFRCYIEAERDHVALTEVFREVQARPIWESLAINHAKVLEGAVQRAIIALVEAEG